MSGKIDDVFEENFMTSAKFSVEIEKIVKDSSLNYIEAVVQFCEDRNIETVSYTHLRAHET